MRGIATTTAAVVSGTSTKTLLQINAPANRTVKPMQLEVSFDGVTAAAVPIQVQFLRTSTAGTGTAVTPVKASANASGTINTTADFNHTAEPTPGDILRVWFIHPQGGSLIYTFPEPEKFESAEAGRLSIRVITPPATVNVLAMLEFEE